LAVFSAVSSVPASVHVHVSTDHNLQDHFAQCLVYSACTQSSNQIQCNNTQVYMCACALMYNDLTHRWAEAQSPYQVDYKWNYEPWGLMDRLQVPLFDEQFRGYGMNKITWSRNIHGQGRAFVVHPYAFMIHQPHPESCAKAIWRVGKPRTNTLKGVVTKGELIYYMASGLTCIHPEYSLHTVHYSGNLPGSATWCVLGVLCQTLGTSPVCLVLFLTGYDNV